MLSYPFHRVHKRKHKDQNSLSIKTHTGLMPFPIWGAKLTDLSTAFAKLKQTCLAIMIDEDQTYSDLLSAFLNALHVAFGGGGDDGYKVQLVLVPDNHG